MNFSEKLRKLRKEKNITQEELANAIYVSRTTITKYEVGSSFPTKENLEKLALFFNVRIDDLVDRDESVKISLESIRLSMMINNIIFISAISVCFLYLVFSFIPLLSGWNYIYPIPPNQTYPNKEYYIISIFFANTNNNNPISIITTITCILNIAIYVIWKILYVKKRKYCLIYLANGLFVINIFLILCSIIFSFSYAL